MHTLLLTKHSPNSFSLPFHSFASPVFLALTFQHILSQMASFLASPTCPVAAIPASSKTSSGNFSIACFSKSFSINGGPMFIGLKHVAKFSSSAAHVSSTRPRCFNATITCSAEAETLKVVQDTIAKQLSIEVSTVAAETKFADLGADSLDTVEIMMALEEQFSVSIGEGGAENIQTVQEA